MEYLTSPKDKFGRSMYLSIIFLLKISVESSGNSDMSFSSRQIWYLFSGTLLSVNITLGNVLRNHYPART